MAYDRQLESRKMIADGVPDVPFALSRRRRFIPVAFDVDGDVAATLFIRRGVSGNPWLESWALEKRDGEWAVLGGGAGDGYDELFEPRDSVAGLVQHLGSGWTIRGGGGLLPWPRRGASRAEMRLAPEVAELQVGRRRVEVADHGVAIVVWASKKTPTMTALDTEGRSLGSVQPTRMMRPMRR